ncbi:hypothetical protein ES332_D05G014200v1 [Gossypium tomentosum]|uniref:Uncharacterized protein n=1 Tax=Gossypium tomentosum TaxID=34277 RepID=A0A5D2KQ61_GOSTO|nr:hypothetical protein ES332_D05G014200v1 [Gossypium tomentosum]
MEPPWRHHVRWSEAPGANGRCKWRAVLQWRWQGCQGLGAAAAGLGFSFLLTLSLVLGQSGRLWF